MARAESDIPGNWKSRTIDMADLKSGAIHVGDQVQFIGGQGQQLTGPIVDIGVDRFSVETHSWQRLPILSGVTVLINCPHKPQNQSLEVKPI